jgi:predicted transcriptional regulator
VTHQLRPSRAYSRSQPITKGLLRSVHEALEKYDETRPDASNLHEWFTRRKVLEAVLVSMLDSGQVTVLAPVRRIADDAGVSRKTAGKCLDELAREGILRVWSSGRPSVQRASLAIYVWGTDENDPVHVPLSTLDVSLDVWSEHGIGVYGLYIYRELNTQPKPVSQVVDASGIPQSTAYRILAALHERGLAGKMQGGWIRGTVEPESTILPECRARRLQHSYEQAVWSSLEKCLCEMKGCSCKVWECSCYIDRSLYEVMEPKENPFTTDDPQVWADAKAEWLAAVDGNSGILTSSPYNKGQDCLNGSAVNPDEEIHGQPRARNHLSKRPVASGHRASRHPGGQTTLLRGLASTRLGGNCRRVDAQPLTASPS